jgi:hypothetical protein
VDDSALPSVIFNFTVTPLSDEPLDITLMASLRSGVGYDVPAKIHTNHAEKVGDSHKLLFAGAGGIGRFEQDANGIIVTTLNGTLAIQSLTVNGHFGEGRLTHNGQALAATVQHHNGTTTFTFADTLHLAPHATLRLETGKREGIVEGAERWEVRG